MVQAFSNSSWMMDVDLMMVAGDMHEVISVSKINPSLGLWDDDSFSQLVAAKDGGFVRDHVESELVRGGIVPGVVARSIVGQ